MLKWTFCYNYQALDKTFQYVYNEIGNIDHITTNGNTVQFGYSDNAHPDRLTSYNNKAITYNANGCVDSYDGWDYTWNDGKLTTIKKTTGSSSRAIIAPVLQPSRTYSFTYNGFGQRTRSQYSYFWAGNGLVPFQTGEVTAFDKKYTYDHRGRLVCEDISKTLYSLGTESSKIVYLYDENGAVGIQYSKGSSVNVYYFQRNLLGDVVAIYDTNGNKVVEYAYDAYGNCTIKSSTTNYDLAHANPIRYRGYYYDEDTKLYYLNARYYSPEFRRFISPDDTSYLNPESVNGLNLYCYCNNDPINFVDPSGHMPKWLAWLCSGVAIAAGIVLSATGIGGIWGGILIGAGAGSLINGYVNEANGGSFEAGYIGGAISGGFCGIGAGWAGKLYMAATATSGVATLGLVGASMATSFAGGFVGNMLGTMFTSSYDRKAINTKSLIYSSITMGALNMFAGFGSGISSDIANWGKIAVDTNSQWAYRLLSGTIAGGTEAFYDTTSYLYSLSN